MSKEPCRLHWSDVYSRLDNVEADDLLEHDAVLIFPNKPNATAFISHLDIAFDDRIVAHGRFDSDTAADYWCAASDESISDALSAAPLTWLEIRSILEQARRARNFHNLAVIGFPPDFDDERFSNFIMYFGFKDGVPVAVAFLDPL